jgi:maltose phosphorylase
MAGTWMSVIEGFAGKRVRNGRLVLNPQIPDPWISYSFKIRFRESVLEIQVKKDNVTIRNQSDKPAHVILYNQEIFIERSKESKLKINTKNPNEKQLYSNY